MKIKILGILFFSTVFLLTVYDGDGDERKTMQKSGKFSSIKSCLSSIEEETKSTLNILRDEPGNVSGTFPWGDNFACKTKATGTEGVYVEGWYSYKE
ncbi:hypothetical protein ACEUAI_13175 [Aeromonas veronii]